MSSTRSLENSVPAAPARVVPGYAATAGAYNSGLLLLRLVVGLGMAAHGSQKLFGFFGGAGLDGTGEYFVMSGYPAGKTMAVVAGLSETMGGLGIALGLLTPLAAAAVVGEMINALTVKGGGYFAPDGIELELLLVIAAASLALTGPGRYALDRFIPVLRSHRVIYGVAAIVLALVVGGVFLLIRA
ncbi:DoxX family protein [Actinocrispum wychmicini]|uniref:Putative oxidoreductase n=1 Tax=Actinocrispum wychmicini TaxID=1213861 RepID=A0A4R2JRR9_9PSEU|nr:DoxX family protein [Actinocrispum wychmicini]TCO62244.1 putative oxidoreductase [Actinocrispum wychmicini]